MALSPSAVEHGGGSGAVCRLSGKGKDVRCESQGVGRGKVRTGPGVVVFGVVEVGV